jgi:hypothetical protein
MSPYLHEGRFKSIPFFFQTGLRRTGTGAAGTEVDGIGPFFEEFFDASDGGFSLYAAAGIERVRRYVYDSQNVNIPYHDVDLRIKVTTIFSYICLLYFTCYAHRVGRS